MDKYIRILLIKISQKYNISITTIQTYNAEKKKINTCIKAIIKNKETNATIKEIQAYGKRTLVSELMKWQKQKE